MERNNFQGVSPIRQGQSGQVVASKWHGRGTSMKSLNRPVTSWHGSLSAPRWIFFLASGRDPRRELVSLGKQGEKFFFWKQQNGGGLSASFGGQSLFFCIFWVHTGGPRWGCQRQGISRPGGRVHLWLWIRLGG